MTTKHYVQKYGLDKGNQFSHEDFVKDMTFELLGLLELNKSENNIKGFDNALRCLTMKWNAISNKTLGVFPEKLWNFFYDTVVIKLRKDMCFEEHTKREKASEALKKRAERRAHEERRFERDFFHNFWTLLAFAKIERPIESFILLGIDSTADADAVKKAYRTLSLKYHPDKGGTQEQFVELTTAKNKCLQFLEQV